jgi:mono/diheme cytochrome c family protein
MRPIAVLQPYGVAPRIFARPDWLFSVTDSPLQPPAHQDQGPTGIMESRTIVINCWVMANMSDSDVLAIVAYLRSVKPISHKVEKSTFKIPLPDNYGPAVVHVADVPSGNTAAYGKYLADIGHCMECHTPMVRGELDVARIGAGGRELPAFPAGVVISANLTPANPHGIAGWTDAQVKNAITGGVRPDGTRLVLLMAFDWYKNITPTDLDALVAYLRTLKPAKP